MFALNPIDLNRLLHLLCHFFCAAVFEPEGDMRVVLSTVDAAHGGEPFGPVIGGGAVDLDRIDED